MSAMTSQPVVVALPALPVPRISRNPNPSADLVAAVVGGELAIPLVRLEQAIADAEAAVTILEAGRPGSAGTADGAAWRDAIASDAEAAEGGELPKRWRTEALILGDAHKWARATALTGAVDLLLRRTAKTVDRSRIAATAGTRAEVAARKFAEAAKAGWESRADKARVWQEVRAGEAALDSFTSARQVKEWAQGAAWGVRRASGGLIPRVDYLPVDAVARGHWLALELYLNPDTTWLHFPRDVVYPDDVGELVVNAFPQSGNRYVGLVERGVVGVDR